MAFLLRKQWTLYSVSPLYKFSSADLKDYARMLGITVPGAKSRVQRARKRLRERLLTSCQVVLNERGAVCCFTPRPK